MPKEPSTRPKNPPESAMVGWFDPKRKFLIGFVMASLTSSRLMSRSAARPASAQLFQSVLPWAITSPNLSRAELPALSSAEKAAF